MNQECRPADDAAHPKLPSKCRPLSTSRAVSSVGLQTTLHIPMLQGCSSSPRTRRRRSAQPSIKAESSPLRSSCAGASAASPTTRRHANAPGPSLAGRRCPCHSGRRRGCTADARTDAWRARRPAGARSQHPGVHRYAAARAARALGAAPAVAFAGARLYWGLTMLARELGCRRGPTGTGRDAAGGSSNGDGQVQPRVARADVSAGVRRQLGMLIGQDRSGRLFRLDSSRLFSICSLP
jgi:hypothetical protein